MFYFISWLIVPAILGLIFQYFMFVSTKYDYLRPVFGIFIVLWATFMIEFWKREEKSIIIIKIIIMKYYYIIIIIIVLNFKIYMLSM